MSDGPLWGRRRCRNIGRRVTEVCQEAEALADFVKPQRRSHRHSGQQRGRLSVKSFSKGTSTDDDPGMPVISTVQRDVGGPE